MTKIKTKKQAKSNALNQNRSLEELIISTNMNGWILQKYLNIFKK